MINYLICIIFLGAFIFFLYALGNALLINNTTESQATKFAAGYLEYSFLVAMGGIVVQALNLKWIVFAFYMGVILIALTIYVLIKKKKNGHLFSCTLAEYLQDNWFLFLICCILCVMLLFYYRAFWYGNHLDDGFYLTQVATMPYEKTGFRTNYSVGVEGPPALAYIFNTWELEASFFIKILHVDPSLFLRLFQSGFNYFVFLNFALAFGQRIVKNINKEYQVKYLQYTLGVYLIFFVYYVYLIDTKLFSLRDGFQLNTAMYYGAAVSKMIIIPGLLLFFVQEKKISLKMIMSVIAISIVLFSKSSIVFPTLVVAVVVCGMVWLLESGGKYGKVIVAIGSLLYIAAAIVLPNVEKSEQEVYMYVGTMLRSPVMWICVIIFAFSFSLKDKIVYRLNTMMVLMLLLILIPQVNDVFEALSVYWFVAGRAYSMVIYAFVILCTNYLYMLLCNWCKVRKVAIIYGLITVLTAGLLIHGYKTDGGELFATENLPANTDMIQDLKVMYHNKLFIPQSTIELGEALEQLTHEKEQQLLVLSPQWASVDGTYHSLSAQIRTYAPDIISVSAVQRYPVEAENQFFDYDQSKYDEFVAIPNGYTMVALKKQVEQYGINCIVVQNEKCKECLTEMGFEQYCSVHDGLYSVWYREVK